MTKNQTERAPPGQSFLGFSLMCLAALAGAAALQAAGSQAFRPYYGSLNPVMATAAVLGAALGSLRLLQSGAWLFVDRPETGRPRFALPVALATGLAIPVILVDLAGGFPEDLNVLPPDALLFYPVIALVAETVFHVVPVTLLILLASRLARGADREAVLTVCLLVVAFTEPVFQVTAGWGESPPWASAYVAVHLLVFSLLALYLFRRFGFFSVLVLRLTYYGLWHVAWGVLRLQVRF